MPCFHPYEAYPAAPPRKGIVFKRQWSYEGAKPVLVPCNHCIGCRLARAQQWAVRMRHEGMYHRESAFLTLTYSDDNLPDDYSVSVREMQLFMKRVRKSVGRPLRFFCCGEYGDQKGRPHYHVILFGYAFSSDRVVWRQTNRGHLVYRSAHLERLWPYGLCELGTVTPQSAGYVARYAVKKIHGDMAVEHYRRVHPITGVEVTVAPEFATMSRRPGIGSLWYQEFKCDAFPSDFLIVDGRKVPVPAFYTKKLDEDEKFRVSVRRKAVAHKRADNNTPERLAVREEVQHLRADRLIRPVE